MTPQTPQGAALSDADILYSQIMNLPSRLSVAIEFPTEFETSAYNKGHRDARHAAAELVSDFAADRRLTAARPDVTHVMDAVWALVRSAPNFDGRQRDVEAAIGAAIDGAVVESRLTAEQGGNSLLWADPPTHISWGGGMKEALLELDKDHTLRLFAEEDALELVAPSLRAALTTQPQAAEPALQVAAKYALHTLKHLAHDEEGEPCFFSWDVVDAIKQLCKALATPTAPTEPTP